MPQQMTRTIQAKSKAHAKQIAAKRYPTWTPHHVMGYAVWRVVLYKKPKAERRRK